MPSNELEFLRDEVNRLNVIISRYQEHVMPDAISFDKKGLFEEDDDTPWLTNQSILSPLIAEYDLQIDNFNRILMDEKNRVDELEEKVSETLVENSNLREDIRVIAKKKLSEYLNNPTGVDNPLGTANLQSRIQRLEKEKEDALELHILTSKELDKLQSEYRLKVNELEIRNTGAQMQTDQINIIANQYNEIKQKNAIYEQENKRLEESVKDLTTEVASLNRELNVYKQREADWNIKETELKSSLNSFQTQCETKETERKKAVKSEKNTENHILEIEEALEKVDEKYSKLLVEHNALESDKNALQEEVEGYRNRKTNYEGRESEAMYEVRHSVQLVEDAMLEKDQAAVREKQKNYELIELREELARAYEEAGIKTRKEVDDVRGICQRKIDSLMDDIHDLQIDAAKRKLELERAHRENKKMEKELERVLKKSSENGQLNDDLYDRCMLAERKCEELMMKNDVHQQMRKTQNDQENIRIQLESQLKECKARCIKMTCEVEEMAEKCIILQEEIDKQKKAVHHANAHKHKAIRQCAKEIAAMKHEHEFKLTEYESKIEAIEELHDSSIKELQQMLHSQQAMNARWKEESKSLQERSERIVFEMKEDVRRHKKRVDELNLQLSTSKSRLNQLEKSTSIQKTRNQEMHEQLMDAQRAAHNSRQQLSNLIQREKKLSSDNRLLTQELHQLRLTTENGAVPTNTEDKIRVAEELLKSIS